MFTSQKISKDLGSEEIVRDIKMRIEDGLLADGEKLPTTRKLCKIYNVSPNTLSKAIRILKARGYLRTRTGAGIYAINPQFLQIHKKVTLQRRTTAFIFRINRGSDPEVRDYLNAIYDNAVLGIQDESAVSGVQTGSLICPENIHRNKESRKDFIIRHSLGADGIYLVGLSSITQNEVKLDLNVPVISIRGRPDGIFGDNVFYIDLYLCAKAIMYHLIEQGYKKIACLGGKNVREKALSKGYGMRKRAWLDTFSEKLMTADEDLLFPCQESVEDVVRVSKEIISLPVSKRPDAVFCFNDFRAWILLQTAREAGLNVPGDLAIAGFDGSARAVNEGITTVELPFYAAGRNAAAAMNGILTGQLMQPVSAAIACGIRIGRTT